MATNVKRKKKAEVMSDDGSMTLTGHLKELRNRLIICAAVFVVGVIGFLAISDKLIDLLTAMAMNANYTFVFLAPQEKLMQYFRVSLIAAVIVTIPVALYQVYAFAKPGLKRSERFFFRLVLLFGLALFCVGVLFAYKVPAVHAELPRHAGGYRLHHGIHQHRELHQPLPDHVHHLWLCV